MYWDNEKERDATAKILKRKKKLKTLVLDSV
jgi:hypothetical protein